MTHTTVSSSLDAALQYLALGFVPIPIKPGSKKPLVEWREFQTRRPSESEVRAWFTQWPDANIAIVTGSVSGIIALDLEAGADLGERPIPPTPMQLTGGGGKHYLFRHPGFPVPNAVRILDKVDVRGDGGYIVVPPSLHPSGRRYEWVISPELEPLAEPPEWLINLLKQRSRASKDWKAIANGVPEGQRNETLASYIGKVLSGLPVELWETAGWDAARGFAARCKPALPEREAREVFESIAKREAAKRGEGRKSEPRAVTPATWDDVAAAFQKWLELPDLDAVRVVLATYVANKMEGDPVWLFLVAPPSSSKTELILSLAELPDVYTLSTLTPNTFLSGKEPKDGKGEISLLPQLTGKILVMKDFAPILQLNRDTQQAIFSQLRDIYDGKHDKAVGNEKRTMRWEGKIGFIAGITQLLDQFSGFLSLLGERFLQYRLAHSDESRVFERAVRNIGKESAMRQELRRVVTGFLQTIQIPHPQEIVIPDAIALRLEALVRLVIRARTGVLRDWYGQREIIYVPDHEGPARLAKQLAMLLMALATLRGSREVSLEDYRIVFKVGLDSLHKLRRQALELLTQEREWTTPEFAIAMGLSTHTARRVLEDLVAVGVARREKAGDYETAPDRWWLDPEKRAWWEVAQP
jgi:hypothetical protein